MGDRTHVQIYLKQKDYNKILKKHFDNSEAKFTNETGCTEIYQCDTGLVRILGEEINYGEWTVIEDKLLKEDIEYDKEWGQGGDYAAGEANYRKTKKGYQHIEIYETQRDLVEFLNKAREIKDPKKLKALINKTYKQHYPFEPEPLNKTNAEDFIKNIKE